MIANFEDFCLWMYVVVDEFVAATAAALQAESGAGTGVQRQRVESRWRWWGECRGWTREAPLLRCWRERPDLFPHIPERSRFNRRRRALAQAINAIRQGTLATLDVAQDRQCAIDSLPVPVLQFHLVPSAAGAAGWLGADFGKVPTQEADHLRLQAAPAGHPRWGDPRLRPGPRQRQRRDGRGRIAARTGRPDGPRRQGLYQRPAGRRTARGVRGGAADHPPPQPAATGPPGHGALAQRRAPRSSRPSTTNSPSSSAWPAIMPTPSRACAPASIRSWARAHPLHLSEPLAGARRFLTPQGVGLPQLAHGPTRSSIANGARARRRPSGRGGGLSCRTGSEERQRPCYTDPASACGVKCMREWSPSGVTFVESLR